jgi:hypothetical protein
MDITDPDTDTERIAETAQSSDEERDHFRYVLWSQASQDRRSRRSSVDRYFPTRRNGEAQDLNRAAPAPQKVAAEPVSASDALTGARKPR